MRCSKSQVILGWVHHRNDITTRLLCLPPCRNRPQHETLRTLRALLFYESRLQAKLSAASSAASAADAVAPADASASGAGAGGRKRGRDADDAEPVLGATMERVMMGDGEEEEGEGEGGAGAMDVDGEGGAGTAAGGGGRKRGAAEEVDEPSRKRARWRAAVLGEAARVRLLREVAAVALRHRDVQCRCALGCGQGGLWVASGGLFVQRGFVPPGFVLLATRACGMRPGACRDAAWSRKP